MVEDGADTTEGANVLERSVHDPVEGESTGTAVALAVGRAKDVPPTELPKLERTLDTDALDRLVASLATRESDVPGQVSFRYAGTGVVVESTGEVVVRADG
ncbi:HalOD1 output domain-containing protein [Halorarum salinum]|uniref:Halobacterial output domain-containing protein n=1 Tax=Halorarum salinum TaxID=2743089 RepID=A0A7D5QGS5_9EURY|nr:HalOD1 output domain-containing protein [Halobaculum salinum]QLG64301.1 hypothetical protein HUG12_21210 [Halobaculum salinum]